MTIHSIGSGARDYPSLSAWIAACPGPNNLVTAGVTWEGECYNDSDSFVGAAPLLTISGITVDATHNVQVRCATGHSFNDNANKLTNALRYNQSNGVGIRTTSGADKAIKISVDYTVIDGLQVKDGTANGAINQTGTGTNAIVKNCYAESACTTTSVGVMGFSGATVVNCIAFLTASAGSGFASTANGSKFRNCDAVSNAATPTSKGFSRSYDSPLLLNCSSFGFASGSCYQNAGGGSWNASSDYNASEDTTAPGTHAIKSKTFSSQFQNISAGTEDFRNKTTADLVGAGTRDQTNTNDLDMLKQSRSTTTPTIGATEFVAASGTTVSGTLGAVAVAGLSATVLSNVDVNATLGAVAVSGFAATVRSNTDVNCTLGAVAISGLAATISIGTVVNSALGSVAISGLPATILNSIDVNCSLGSVGIQGYGAQIIIGGVVVGGHGSDGGGDEDEDEDDVRERRRREARELARQREKRERQRQEAKKVLEAPQEPDRHPPLANVATIKTAVQSAIPYVVKKLQDDALSKQDGVDKKAQAILDEELRAFAEEELRLSLVKQIWAQEDEDLIMLLVA